MNFALSSPQTPPPKTKLPRIPNAPQSPTKLHTKSLPTVLEMTTSTPEKVAVSSQPVFPPLRAFDRAWSLTTDDSHIPVYDLLKLLHNLRLESLHDMHEDNELIHMDDMVIKSRIVEQTEFLHNVNKEQAYQIIYQSFYDAKEISKNTGSLNLQYDIFNNQYDSMIMMASNNGSQEDNDDEDYDETATLMEMTQNSPLQEDYEDILIPQQISNWVKPNIKLALTELEQFHIKLNNQYLGLENDLRQIKSKNDLDLKELQVLVGKNDHLISKLNDIRDELSGINNCLMEYRDQFDMDSFIACDNEKTKEWQSQLLNNNNDSNNNEELMVSCFQSIDVIEKEVLEVDIKSKATPDVQQVAETVPKTDNTSGIETADTVQKTSIIPIMSDNGSSDDIKESNLVKSHISNPNVTEIKKKGKLSKHSHYIVIVAIGVIFAYVKSML
ncbi:hypothetical protein FOB64_004220 [Candida albicans]|uniref:Uncharacterized protein n=1 Tax=Candida albicans TaxID=5476 RepID=A0A8H6BYY5_CANAX|nr:hypothetical protein FOB64_004220 [Candida albicans]